MPLDSYVTLGRSGLRVSPFCLGAMTFGEDHGWGATEAASAAMMNEYLDRGGNFIDTANIYTNGHSEKIIGDFFAKKSTRRDRTVIGTKFFCNLHEGDPNGGGAGRKAMVDQCEDSLRRLRMDYIDIYWLHNWDRTVPVEETLRCLDDLVTAGKIRYIGFSDIPAWKAAEAQTIAHFRGWSPVVATQLEYSLLERTAEGELIPMARECGMGVMPWSPLRSGFLSGKYSRENARSGAGSVDTRRTGLMGMPRAADYDVIEAVDAVAMDLGVTPAAVALAWVRGRPGITSTIIGARRLDQFRENLSALDVTLGKEQVDALNEVSKPTLDFPADINRDLVPMLAFAGATVDGVRSEVSPMLASSPVRY
ncbi:aldo/keto reductase [Streptomyces sp. 35G-GA-8]|uniref:aldo/keto reductase n=1 Tax=Streptomyces sp. 35G-GA-8 TaxID=2939434 RepID=UPI00201E998D|nr:aldo/keto reductase [Streptomyces sp. 35G-GA-8]MCL7380619.1 aldo/keto reductase [Streptomyces sp. 35G-GA-8]